MVYQLKMTYLKAIELMNLMRSEIIFEVECFINNSLGFMSFSRYFWMCFTFLLWDI